MALMYFLKTLKGADLDLPDGVVVIDDPVASLDANSLYNAFAYIQAQLPNEDQYRGADLHPDAQFPILSPG